MKQLLFADNDPHFLKSRTKFLERAGFQVITANTLEETERLLSRAPIQLAILDLRLVNDRDERDRSGLNLARNKAYRHVPKIILTKFPTYEDVREALGPALDGLPPAVSFLAKQEGPNALIRAVENAFERYVRINVDLVIQFNQSHPISFLALAGLTKQKSEIETLPQRAAELENLFRRVFLEESQIRIDKLLWQSEDRVALTVIAFANGKADEGFVVVCGEHSRVSQESLRYRQFGPHAPGRISTVLTKSGETAHFAANAYALAETDTEKVSSLQELYRSGPEKAFVASLTNLFESTLAGWHQEKRVLSGPEAIEELYCKKLNLREGKTRRVDLAARVRALVQRVATIGHTLEFGSGHLAARFGGLSYCYPDPTALVYETSGIGQPALLMHTPGTLSGDNVLVDGSGKTWLTDFAEAGLAPVLWNYVQLEAAIRFDWVECNKVQWLHDLERCLTSREFSKFNIGDVEQPLRKPLRGIQTIRRLASRFVGNDPSPYHLGVFFHAMKRIAEFKPEFHLTPNEIARLGHALIAASLIADYFESSKRGSTDEPGLEQTGIQIDKVNRRVSVNGRRVSLPRQSYELLCALHERPDHLFTRRELGVHIFGEKYDETEISHINRLNTAIFRLRVRIEDDPKHPRFLITEPVGGYRLVTL